jgi:hypothetical protein
LDIDQGKFDKEIKEEKTHTSPEKKKKLDEYFNMIKAEQDKLIKQEQAAAAQAVEDAGKPAEGAVATPEAKKTEATKEAPKKEAAKFLVRAGEFKALVDQKYGNAWISAEGQHRPEELAELVQEYLKRNSTHVREELLAANFMAVEAGTEKDKGSKRLGQKETRYENIISDLMANKDPQVLKQIIGDEVEVRRENIKVGDNGVSFTLDWEGLAGRGGGSDALVTLERTAFGEVAMTVKTHGANIDADQYQQYAKEVDALSVSDKSQLGKYRKILNQGKNMTASNITDDLGVRLSQIRKNHQAWARLDTAIGYKESEGV